MPKGTSLIEPPLTQPHVWVHYKINKLPVPEWGAELSQLRPVEVIRVPGVVPVGWELAGTLCPGKLLKTPSQIHPDLGTR